jgi:uncharacterized protein
VTDAFLQRIAEALERMAPAPAPGADLFAHHAYHWDGKALAVIDNFHPLPLSLIVGVDRQRDAAHENSRRHAQGFAAHDVLLWGARGMGKSALVKSVVAALQAEEMSVALVEATADNIATLPALFAKLRGPKRNFILFIDDIAFDDDQTSARLLRSMMEGGAEARPDNVRLYVTSNRRNIVNRNMAAQMDAQGDVVNARDADDDTLALADRFGLKLGFQYPDQDAYLAIVAAYTDHFGLTWDKGDALNFAHLRGGRSGRIAWHYAVELAGRVGRRI